MISGNILPFTKRLFLTVCQKSLASLVSFPPFVKTGISAQKGVVGYVHISHPTVKRVFLTEEHADRTLGYSPMENLIFYIILTFRHVRRLRSLSRIKNSSSLVWALGRSEDIFQTLMTVVHCVMTSTVAHRCAHLSSPHTGTGPTFRE